MPIPFNPKSFFTRKLVFVLVGLFILFFVCQVIYHTVERFRWSREIGNKTIFHYGELPACGDKKELFTVSPIKDGLYRNIVPLGELGPNGGHVIPTKHIYFIAPAKNVDEQPPVDIYSPGDLYVTTIEKWENQTRGTKEYFVYTSPCQDVEVNFYHFDELSPKLMEAFNNIAKCDWERSNNPGLISYRFCGKITRGVQVRAGELLARATPANKGGIKQFFDFEMSDHRTPALNFANPNRWVGGFDFKHIVCPVEYFTPALRTKFLSQMAGYDQPEFKRTTEPLCGSYMQDVAGTAQGVWFKPGKTADSEENLNIALVHHNALPQKADFSIGMQAVPTIEGGAYPFDPKPRGLVDRDFKDITADGKTYCFEPTGITGTYNYPFRIILQMTSPTKLKIEGQKTQGCGTGPWTLGPEASEFER